MNFDSYKNHGVAYPDRKKFSTYYYYSKGKVVHTCSGDSDVAPDGIEYAFREKVLDEAAFDAARKAYLQAETDALRRFKEDLFADLGISDHPLRDKLFSKAWDDGHSSGYSEVYNCALNLVDLFELPPGAVLVTKDAVICGGIISATARKAAEKLAGELAK